METKELVDEKKGLGPEGHPRATVEFSFLVRAWGDFAREKSTALSIAGPPPVGRHK